MGSKLAWCVHKVFLNFHDSYSCYCGIWVAHGDLRDGFRVVHAYATGSKPSLQGKQFPQMTTCLFRKEKLLNYILRSPLRGFSAEHVEVPRCVAFFPFCMHSADSAKPITATKQCLLCQTENEWDHEIPLQCTACIPPTQPPQERTTRLRTDEENTALPLSM